eukprot:3753631-Heterocapsa_arctica.AAC.1
MPLAIYYTCGLSTRFRALFTTLAASPPNSVRYLQHLQHAHIILCAIYIACGKCGPKCGLPVYPLVWKPPGPH